MLQRSKTRQDKNGNPITIRSAKPEDAKAILKYLKKVNGESKFLLCEPEEIDLTLEQETEILKRKEKDPKEVVLMAFDGDKHIGNAAINRIGTSSRYAHRCSIAVALYKAYEGRGIGPILIDEVLKAAKKMGYEKAELEVYSNNKKAFRLYTELGFDICGIYMNGVKYSDGTYANVVTMSKELKSARGRKSQD